MAIIQLLESMARSARRNRRGAILACILECILHLIRRWIEYFNSWAFVYVGIYGYDYLTAGKNVIAMFQAQGWSAFISDRLVYRVLYSVHIGVGLMAGCAALLGDMATGPVFGKDVNSHSDSDTAEMSHLLCFFLGLIIGMILSSVSLFVVESATRSIIVCFAESPMEFQEHHPDLCEEMKQGWSQAYPQAWNDEVMTERFNKTSSSSSPVGKTENNPLV